jgi:hypothetical protein
VELGDETPLVGGREVDDGQADTRVPRDVVSAMRVPEGDSLACSTAGRWKKRSTASGSAPSAATAANNEPAQASVRTMVRPIPELMGLLPSPPWRSAGG